MKQTTYKVYRYRWVVLLAFMLVVIMNQLLWITYAPITSSAATYYQVSDLSVGLLSMCFMIVYIIISLPASWVIDTYGMRTAVGIGAVLTGVFGLLRGLAGTNYTLALLAQIGIAIGQPFILNAITKIAARWFPVNERATASGLGTLAMYAGIFLGIAMTPYITIAFGIGKMLFIYGIISALFAVAFFTLAKENPPTPPCSPEQEKRSMVFDGLKQALHKRQFILLMIIFFIGLGVFNAVTTWIENIVGPRGFSITQAGMTGGLMIVGGIAGALVIPALSDRYRRRVPFILLSLAGATIGLAGVTFATAYGLLLASAFTMGFFLLSAGPIGFQYGAEVAYPAPEGTTNGLLLLMGQISGIAFIFGMDSFKSAATGSMSMPLIVLCGLMALSLLLSAFLKESALIKGS
ncbi:MAG: MFS transporter [Bacteroidales bacterium]|nr:MFS transporter [Bacteroidales bacterium]